jgi:hypothetical protein
MVSPPWAQIISLKIGEITDLDRMKLANLSKSFLLTVLSSLKCDLANMSYGEPFSL